MLTPDQIAFLKQIASNNALQINREPMFAPLALRMRRACPVHGDKWDKFMTVWLEPGEGIEEHAHKRNLILYYPEATSQLFTEDSIIYPGADTLIYLSPGNMHSVAPVSKPRLSVAMLVSE